MRCSQQRTDTSPAGWHSLESAMSLTISIMTAISAGIYASQGGGTTQARHTWPAGPLNLLRATQLLPEHQRRMNAAYGNIGHAGSWVQIDDQRIDPMDLPATMAEARDLLARVQSGAYAAWLVTLAQCAAEEATRQQARDAQRAAEGMAEMAALASRIEAAERAAGEAQAARDAAAWQAQQQAEADAAAAECAAIVQRQAARETARSMRRDWRRAGC